MKDFAGNELEVGQRVVVITTGRYSSVDWAVVAGFTPKMVKVMLDRDHRHIVVRHPESVILPVIPKRKMTSEEYLSSYDASDYENDNWYS